LSQVDDLGGQSPVKRLRGVLTRLWLVALVAVVCAGAAYLLANNQPRKYQASARLMYQPPTDSSNPAASSSSVNTDSMAIQLQSVGTTLADPVVKTRALSSLGEGVKVPSYTVTATIVTPEASGAAMVYPNMVEIMAEAGSPTSAAKIANAYAAAVIVLRKENQQVRFKAAEAVVADQLKAFVTPEAKKTVAYASLEQQWRDLQIARATATGDFTVVVPATPPSAPASPQPKRSAALGLGVGLVAGVALAFLVSRLDTRVRTHRQVAEILRLPVVGRLPPFARHALRTGMPIVLAEPDGHFSEALRMLRSNLEWANVDGHTRSILVASCVKGEGKSVTICNLAVTLAKAGKNVVIVDGDLRAPRVHDLLNVPNEVGLTSFVRGTAELKAVMQFFPLSESVANDPAKAAELALDHMLAPPTAKSQAALWVITSGPLPPDAGEFVATQGMVTALKKITSLQVDYVLIDAPPVLSVGDAAAMSASVDALLLVTNIDKVNRSTLVDGRDQLDLLPCRKAGVVVVGERVDYKKYQ
jgi:Mrp family chromosome partitioning ATPase